MSRTNVLPIDWTSLKITNTVVCPVLNGKEGTLVAQPLFQINKDRNCISGSQNICLYPVSSDNTCPTGSNIINIKQNLGDNVASLDNKFCITSNIININSNVSDGDNKCGNISW